MKIEFLIENVEQHIGSISKILPLHSQIPVISNLLIEATKEGIFIHATNLEVGIRVKIAGKITEEGALTVPGKQFIETLSSLPKDKVELEQEGESLTVKCRGNRVVFQTIPKEEFPRIFEEKGEKIHTFSDGELKNIFSSLVFAASQDEGRPELTGVLISSLKGGQTDFVATDGFRLSLKKVFNIDIKGEDNKTLILPAKVILEAMSLPVSTLDMYIYKKSNQVIFESDDVVLVGRLLAGTFPTYEKVIPGEGKTKIHLDVEEFLQKLRLVSVFARDSANIVKTKISDGKMTMQAKSAGVGEGELEIEGKQEGESNEIAFNIKFLSDFLKNTTAKSITLQVSSPVEPALFKVDNDPELTHIIMPVRVQE